MVWIGILLLLAGAGMVYAAVRTQRRVYAMMAAETLTVPELLDAAAVTAELNGGPGHFRKVCEVVGETAPGPAGLLRSELAGVDCVWHAHTVERRLERRERDSDGRWQTTTSTETVSRLVSPHGWPLLRDGHTIGVDPGGRRPEPVELVHDRFDPVDEPSRGDSRTIGYRHQEWVLRPGTAMYVLGEVDDRDGPLVIRAPQSSKDPFVLSTRTEQQLTDDARRNQRWLSRGGAAVAVLGLVLTVVGSVT